jgi:hypothetical protein
MHGDQKSHEHQCFYVPILFFLHNKNTSIMCLKNRVVT